MSTSATFPAPPPCVGRPVFASAPTNDRVPPLIGSTPVRGRSRLHPGYVILLIVVAAPIACAIGIASFFHLSSPTRALRGAVMESVAGQWRDRVGINVGYFTCALARYASSFVKLPPEARAGIDSIQGAEVSISHLERPAGPPNFTALISTADKAMGRRHWQRIVGVAQDKQFVAVYAPEDLRSFKHASCCVVVLNGKDLVVVSARANLTSLLDVIEPRIHEKFPSAKT